MKHEHLDPAALDRILALDRTEDQNRSLLHQIAVCPECRAAGGWLLDLHEAGLLSLRFGPLISPDRFAIPAVIQARGQTRTSADMLIASTAQEHCLTLVTRNVRHFADCGIPLLNPFREA